MRISLNSILMALVITVSFFFFSLDKTNSYLYGDEIPIFFLLLSTFTFLIINRYLKNIFLEILNVYFVIFFICRLPFLLVDGVFSDVLSKNISGNDINYSLFILIYSYSSLALSIIFLNPKIPKYDISLLTDRKIKKIIWLTFFITNINVFFILFVYDINVATLGNIPSILLAIFTVTTATLTASLLLVVLPRHSLNLYKYQIIFILLECAFVGVYSGNKSGLIQVLLVVYLVWIFIHGPLYFRLRGLVGSFLLFLAVFILFFLGDSIRFYQRGLIEAGGILERSLANIDNYMILVHGFSYRIGHLDFFIDKLSLSIYRPYVSFQYYLMAIIDRLTPGFNVFDDTAFMSRQLYNVYYSVPDEGNASEQITLFAEYHLLFWFFSPIFYFISIYILKLAIKYFAKKNQREFPLYGALVVLIYFTWLNSFGLDMLVSVIVYYGLFVYLFLYMCEKR